jgi:hypothetical protein
LLNTVIAISINGTELWQNDLPDLTFQDPRVSPNGTFLVNAYDAGGRISSALPGMDPNT